MHELRRSFVFALALAAGLFSIVPASAATDLPQKPILLVASQPGLVNGPVLPRYRKSRDANVNVAPFFHDSPAFTKLVRGDVDPMARQLQTP